MSEDNKERLQKVLARAGIASRRKAEILILEGSVTVNGSVVTELGTKVDPLKDKIKVDGKLIYTEVSNVYVVLNKPKGVISAMSDPEGRPTLSDYIKSVQTKVNPIGRLDYNSEGLILLTNDGELAEKILKSRSLGKTYLVKVKGHPQASELEFLQKGFFTKEGVLRFSDFDIDSKLRNKSWLRLDVSEGAKLDIRELFNRKGLLVDKIVRSAIGHISIEGIPAGEYRMCTKREFEKLLEFTPANTRAPGATLLAKARKQATKEQSRKFAGKKKTEGNKPGRDRRNKNEAGASNRANAPKFGDKKLSKTTSPKGKPRDRDDKPKSTGTGFKPRTPKKISGVY